ncbi:MAG TPA: hypothetical protein VEL49_08020 [Ktedonobacteraceae bacterium]|nr:hypothetical protein [Ktedonobacteraceae bacterium]
MRRKTLVLLGAGLGALSPILLQPVALSLAVVIILIPLSVILIVLIALLNQEVHSRLIELITAIPSQRRQKALTKRN